MNNSIPVWFKILVVFLILWNFIGILNFIGQITISEQDLLALPIDQQNLINNRPFWAIVAFGIAVVSGFLGSLTLLLKKKISAILLQISLFAVIVDFCYATFVFEAQNSPESFEIILTISIIFLAILLVYLANFAKKKGWLC